MNKKWISVGAVGSLSVAALATGAATVANATELRNQEGQVVGGVSVKGDLLEREIVVISATPDHASVVSPTSAPSAIASASSPAAVSVASPEPVSALSPVSPMSPVSAISAPSNG